MAIVKPFKGIRPPKELVEQVESRPYDVLDSEEARAEAGDNEKSLIRGCMRRLLRISRGSRIKGGSFRMNANIIISMRRQ